MPNTKFTVPVTDHAAVSVQVFDVQGRLVRNVFPWRGRASPRPPLSPGTAGTEIRPTGRGRGLYWFGVRTGARQEQRKLVLIQ